MAVSQSEKLDHILKAYILDVQSWLHDNFKYAAARSCILEETSFEVRAELKIVMYKKPQDIEFLIQKINKLTTKYNKKYKIAIQPVLQWESEEACCSQHLMHIICKNTDFA